MDPQQVSQNHPSDHPPEPTGTPAFTPLVLLVDDDRRMLRYLRMTLVDQHLRVVETETGSEALVQAAAHNPDLILLDFALPDTNAICVTAKLREWTAAPILIVSARDEEHEKVASLDAGANDFLTKPFSTTELLARIRVWLRHTHRAAPDSLSTVIDVGPLRIDFGRRLTFVGGREVHLTPTQYKLFATLMRNSGKVMTHEQILFSVWGPAYTKETQYLRVYMGQLRQKFEGDPARPKYFLTEPGVGYRLRASS